MLDLYILLTEIENHSFARHETSNLANFIILFLFTFQAKVKRQKSKGLTKNWQTSGQNSKVSLNLINSLAHILS